jgi:hypothetical protein
MDVILIDREMSAKFDNITNQGVINLSGVRSEHSGLFMSNDTLCHDEINQIPKERVIHHRQQQDHQCD